MECSQRATSEYVDFGLCAIWTLSLQDWEPKQTLFTNHLPLAIFCRMLKGTIKLNGHLNSINSPFYWSRNQSPCNDRNFEEINNVKARKKKVLEENSLGFLSTSATYSLSLCLLHNLPAVQIPNPQREINTIYLSGRHENWEKECSLVEFLGRHQQVELFDLLKCSIAYNCFVTLHDATILLILSWSS